MKKLISLFCFLLTIKILAVPTLNPPTDLFADNITDSSLNLRWKDNSPNEKYIYVYQSSDGVNWLNISKLGRNTQFYSVKNLNSYTKYYFKVASVNGQKISLSTPIQVSTKDLANHLNIGNYYLASQFVDGNNQGISVFVGNQDSDGYLISYDRNKNVTKSKLGISSMDLSLSTEATILDNNTVILAYLDRNLTLHVREYLLLDTNLFFQGEITSGDISTRWIDILKLSNGKVVVSAYQQNPGVQSWILIRNSEGAWMDAGLTTFIQADIGQPAGVNRMAEMPWDNSLWFFSIKDSWGTIYGFKYDTDSASIITNKLFCVNTTFNGNYVDGEMTPHGEYPVYFKITTDWINNRLIAAYQNEDRMYNTNVGLSLSKIALTSFNADGSKNLIYISTNVTERVSGNLAINLDTNNLPILYYIPLSLTDTNWPPNCPLTKFDGIKEEKQINLDFYSNIAMNRKFNDIIGKRQDGNITIIFN